MAFDKAVDSTALNAGLTKIADAIRAKGGTEGTMAFPDGFTEMIEAIQAGGGSNVPLSMGTFTPTEDSKRVTVEHNLGVTPNLYIAYLANEPSANTSLGNVRFLFMYCPDIFKLESYLAAICYSAAGTTNTSIFKPSNGDSEITSFFTESNGVAVREANAQSVILSAYLTTTGMRYFLAGKTYQYIIARIDV